MCRPPAFERVSGKTRGGFVKEARMFQKTAAVFDGHAHGVDAGQILARDDLGQVPAERAVGSREVVDALEAVRLVENDVQFVVGPRQSVGQNREPE